MALTLYDPNTPLEYVPAFGNNRSSDNPCVVRLKPVGHGKMQKYERLIVGKTRGEKDRLSAALQEVQKQQFLDNVESVTGLFVGAREVTDPEELYDVGDTGLIAELIHAMEHPLMLKEGLLNKQGG